MIQQRGSRSHAVLGKQRHFEETQSMHVAEIIRDKGDRIVAMRPEDSVAEAARILERENIGAIMVRSDSGEVLGIISERDIVHSIALKGAPAIEEPVSDVMTTAVMTCTPDMDTEALMEKMLSARIRHLPVVSDGQLVGMISIMDVIQSVLVGLKWVRSALQQQVIKSAGWSIDED